jgi:peptide/nickel transport system substrate-binding protein
VLNPSLDGGQGGVVYGPMFNFIIGRNADGVIDTSYHYGVAESYEPNADASEWTFKIKDGYRWHDGEPLTAEDVAFTLEYFTREEAVCTACGPLRGEMDRVEVVDPNTVKLSLKAPDVSIPELLASGTGDIRVVPKHYHDSAGEDGFNTKPIGSGPWKFVAHVPGESLQFEANTDYVDPEAIPYFQQLELRLAPEVTTRVAQLTEGSANLVAITSEQIADLKAQGFGIAGPKSIATNTIMFWRSWDPAFLTNKLEFRKALALAIDYDSVISSYYPPEAATREGVYGFPSAPGTEGHDPSLPPYEYDADAARQLLSESGYNGEPVTIWNFALAQNPNQLQVNEVYGSFWRDIGVNVTITPIDYGGAFRPRAVAEPPDFQGPADITTMVPPPTTLRSMRNWMLSHEDGGTFYNYWDPEKAATYYQEASALVDPQARDARLKEMMREFHEEYWTLPIAMLNAVWAVSPDVTGWAPAAGDPVGYHWETIRPT